MEKKKNYMFKLTRIGRKRKCDNYLTLTFITIIHLRDKTEK
jgi:hypothetical protein